MNWGASEVPPQVLRCFIINDPNHIQEVSNKLKFFTKLEGQKLTPDFATDTEKVKKWLDKERQAVCRTILTGSAGRGIVIADTEEGLVEAELYVKYIPKKDEYRVHIFDDEIIDDEFYAIIDITNKPKSFFKNQKLVNFQKKWFFHDHINPNFKKPNLEYLSKIENEYGVNIWKLALNERIFSSSFNICCSFITLSPAFFFINLNLFRIIFPPITFCYIITFLTI